MKIDVTRIGKFLRVQATVKDPEIDFAVNPTSIEISFFIVDAVSGTPSSHPLGTVALTQVGSITGLFGVSLDTSNVSLENTVAVVNAVVNGKDLLEEVDLSGSVGAPQITITEPVVGNLVEL